MYIQLLRLWATSTESSPGWLRADMDRDIGGPLDAIHANPARAWSNAEMAQYAHLSRTTFAERFTRILGQPPMAYLTEFRMELARDLLLNSTDTGKQVARRTGLHLGRCLQPGIHQIPRPLAGTVAARALWRMTAIIWSAT